MTIEQYNELKQKVINLRQSAVAEQGSEYHAKIWEELKELEELLQKAQINNSSVDNNMSSKIELPDNSNIIEKPFTR